MNHNSFTSRMFAAFVVILAITAIAQTSRAAFDAYLKIDGVSGEGTKTHKIIHCTGGSCSIGRLPVGTYKVTVAWVQGGKTAMDDWMTITKASASTPGAPAATTFTVTSKPQNNDAAMQATGKRMHKPFSITKTTDSSSPMLFSVAAADVDGDGMVDCILTCRKAGGQPMK